MRQYLWMCATALLLVPAAQAQVPAGASLGALATSLVLGVELAFLEPWLLGLIAQRQADESIAGVPVNPRP